MGKIEPTSSSYTMSFTASEDVLTVINNLDSLSFTNETARFRAKEAAVALLARLETPWETAFRWIYAGPTMLSALKIAVDLDLFGKWQRSGQDEQNIAQLAQLVSCDTELLGECLKRFCTHEGLALLTKQL